MFFSKRKTGQLPQPKPLRQINAQRMQSFYAGDEYEMEIAYLRNLKDKFNYIRHVDEPIDLADVLAAFRIIQYMSSMLAIEEGIDDKNYLLIDHLCRCAIEIVEKGDLKLNEGNLAYIKSKMPLDSMIDKKIAMLHRKQRENLMEKENQCLEYEYEN